jgi:hypothetical protein
MQTTSTSFKNMIVNALNEVNTEEIGLRSITTGDEDVIAKGIVSGIETGSIIPIVFGVRRHLDHMIVETRKVASAGSGGNLMNATACEYLHTLLAGNDEDSDRLRDRFGLLRLFFHTYMASPHTAEEFVANLVEATNDRHVYTRAIRDPRDGEIYVAASTECDFVHVPHRFAMVAGGVLSHAREVNMLVRVFRDMIHPNSQIEEKVLVHALAAQVVGARANGDKPPSTKKTKAAAAVTL